MTSATHASLSKAFGIKDGEDSVITKLSELQQIFNVSSDELFVEWESFNVTKVQDNLELNLENLERFHEHMQSNLVNTASNATPSLKKIKDFNGRMKPVIRSTNGLTDSSPLSANPVTPKLKRKNQNDDFSMFKTPRMDLASSPGDYATANNTFQNSTAPSPSPTSAKTSGASHTVIETLNPNVEEAAGVNDSEKKAFTLLYNFDPSKYKFRTMSMKLLESADVLDDQIDTMTRLFLETGKENVNFGNPCVSSQFEMHCCGRIVPDSPLYDKELNQNLNSTSLFLETSRLGGIGQRIPLDLTNVSDYSLFPGQIAVLKGRNPTGSSFVVQEICSLPSLGSHVSSKQELEQYQEQVGEGGLKILIASGPYSNAHTLDFTKMNKLVERINTVSKPHVVLLFGPFIDINHNAVAQGDIELKNEKHQPQDYNDLFQKTISQCLKKVDPKIQVILIPSLQDACIKHCSYPQDSFDRKKLGLPKNVRVIPNPSTFSLNETMIACSNLDIFKDLREVFSLGPSATLPSNRFERIAGHVFDQRRFYPVFPGSIKKTNKDNNEGLYTGLMGEQLATTMVGGSSLEVPYMGLAELGDTLPDLLIAPSELKFFAKVIRGVIVINPGNFIRPHNDPNKEEGTYVTVSIGRPEVNEEDKVPNHDDLYYNHVYRRSRVDIMRNS